MDGSKAPAFFYFTMVMLSVPIYLLNITHTTFNFIPLKKYFLFVFIRYPVDMGFPEKNSEFGTPTWFWDS